jgi:hypothetical protein
MDMYLHVHDYYFISQLSVTYFCRSAYRVTAFGAADLPKAQRSAIVAGIDKLQLSDETRNV